MMQVADFIHSALEARNDEAALAALRKKVTGFSGEVSSSLRNVEAILFDLDDTLIVDEEISKSAMEVTARLATKLHGADSARFLIERQADFAGPLAGKPGLGLLRRYRHQRPKECLWGEFAGQSSDLTALRSWSMEFRDRSLRCGAP